MRSDLTFVTNEKKINRQDSQGLARAQNRDALLGDCRCHRHHRFDFIFGGQGVEIIK